ncbi:OmpA family protein [Nitratireductor pacificus]|uniref:OmpA/MotB protein n=1 Tax=Nitratireductor pacificus pht-3B TaxID=391937 RepID=K2N179_9HYPH|nr:OmpA family protein [Nitratireductor pacificus]EKF17988.1 OmpA/MotB protein [Nitratireductor pacificus pht-3B]
MKTRKRIVTNTALGLILAAAPLALAPAPAMAQQAPIILAQAEEKPEGMTEEAWRALLLKRQGEQGGEAQGEDAGAPEGEAAQPEPAPEPPAEAAPAEPEPKPEPEPEPQPEPEVMQETPEQPAAPEAAPEQPQTEQAPEHSAPQEPEAPVEEPAAEQPPEEQPEAEQPAQTEEAPAQPEAPAAEEPEQTPAETEAPADAPAEQPPAPETQQAPEAEQPETTTPAEGEAGEAPAGENVPTPEPAPDRPTEPEAGTGETPPADAEAPAQESAGEEAGEVLPENAAPVLDSQKEDGAAEAPQPADGEAAPTEATQAPAAEEAAPAPETDAEAQAETIDAETLKNEIREMVREEGQRIEMGATREERRERRRERRERREGTEVVREFNDNRTIIEINNQIFVESPDSDRMVRDDDEVYYEELPRGRVREVVIRPDGVRLITVRDRYGDIIRRVRVAPDGREQVLVFVPDDRLRDDGRWHDPARDLPPLRLTIPVSDYILEAERIEDPDRYYTFLQKPPVEQVRRIYSLEEVKRSARVRDMVRRIDLDTIEFAFGSADIEESEIDELEAIANAIERMLRDNPAESFLIEGHTDAVGSDLANLALSDRRAESVARALTEVFAIPPENLVTQGYGERYLKIATEERERENRRVALRRITPLVAPVASAN